MRAHMAKQKTLLTFRRVFRKSSCLSPAKAPSSKVCRGLKEEVKALFPNGADIEVILNVAEALAQKELETERDKSQMKVKLALAKKELKLALAEQEIKNNEDLIFRLENDQLPA